VKAAHFRLVTGLVWLIVVSVAMVILENFKATPGNSMPAPQRWPNDVSIHLDGVRPTLLMFAHPRCPCTRASIGELNRLLARCGGNIAAHVIFFKPASQGNEWAETDSWREAKAIPGVTVDNDTDGRLAHQFGAETSGAVLLFDPNGQQLFSGGITAGRGHSGDNAGADVIVALVNCRKTAIKETFVYGCSLAERRETASEGRGL
jgi:hypothetical protein